MPWFFTGITVYEDDSMIHNMESWNELQIHRKSAPEKWNKSILNGLIWNYMELD